MGLTVSPVQHLMRRSARRWIIHHAPDSVATVLRQAVDREARARRAWWRRQREKLRRRVVGRYGTSRTAVTYAGRQYVARTVRTYRCDEAAADHLALVVTTLDAAGIQYTVLAPDGLDRRVVVAAPDRPRVLDALRARTDRPVYVVSAQEERPRDITTGRFNGERALRLFEFRATTAGKLLSGPEVACTVEFWEPVTDADTIEVYGEELKPGSLRAPHTNPWAGAIGRPDRCPVATVEDKAQPVAPQAVHPHIFRVGFPIDVVYTWVDGADPAWLRRKQERLAHTHGTATHVRGAADSRYTPHDELRYSLRSLEMFAPWVRHVYLVTDDQVPDWLDTSHPRVRVVSHRELFADSAALPTFNSQAIESQLHRIPGLSEHFLYFNDDFFIGRPVEPELFFASNGLARFFLSTVKIGGMPVSDRDSLVMAAAKNNRDLVSAQFGASVTARFKHVPYPLRVSVLQDLEDRFASDLTRTATTPFRSMDDVAVPSSLHHYYAYLTGRAMPGTLASAYVDLGEADVARRLSRLLDSRAYDAFCINEGEKTGAVPRQSAQLLGWFLDEYFPLPSSFERADAS